MVELFSETRSAAAAALRMPDKDVTLGKGG
jgi:hypothetical protein